jgi:hypothetical protein
LFCNWPNKGSKKSLIGQLSKKELALHSHSCTVLICFSSFQICQKSIYLLSKSFQLMI